MRPETSRHLYIFIYIVLSLTLLGTLYYKTRSDKTAYIAKTETDLLRHYHTTLYTFEALSDNFYYTHEEEIAEALYRVIDGSRDRDTVRRELYDKLVVFYHNHQRFGLRQLHIHLPEAVSFLRFHLPEKYGDALYELRPSLRGINLDYRYRMGYEIGRYYDGFRYLYPLFYKGTFVGSLEWGQSFNSLTTRMKKEFGDHYFFIIDRELLRRKVSPEYLERYYPTTMVHPDFKVFKYLEIAPEYLDALTRGLAEEPGLSDQLHASANVAKSIKVGDREHLLILVPIPEIAGNPAGYLVMFKEDATLHSYDTNFMIQALLVLVLLALALFHLYRIASERRTLKTLLDLQKEMVVMTRGNDMLSANQALLNYFDYSTFEAFKVHHHCICDFFLPEEGYLQKRMQNLNWTDYLLMHPNRDHLAKIRNPRTGKAEVFLVQIQALSSARGHIVSFVNVTGMSEEAQHLEFQATRDALTGIFNRAKFNESFETERRRCIRYEHPMCLALFDIDWFKAINDRHGHDIGDKVLIELAHFVQKQIRDTDLLFRWGGEEFVLLQPDTEVETAREVCERLRERIARQPFAGTLELSCSFGITSYRPPESLESVFKRVDQALYKAKADGRNRTAIL